MQFAEILKSLRLEKGLSHSKLGPIFEVHSTTISHWERGKVEPNIDTLIKIAKYFNVSLDYLCGRTSDITLPAIEYQHNNSLTLTERKIIELYRQIDPDFQKLVPAYAETLKEKHNKETEKTHERS